MKRIISFLLLISTLFLCLASCGDFANNEKYKEGLDLINEGKYEEAYAFFLSMGDDEGAKEYLSRFHYVVTSLATPEGETYMIQFDENNFPAQYIEQMGDDSIALHFAYEYEKSLNKITFEYTFGEEHIEGYQKYTYDENHNIIKEIYMSSEGVTKVYEYTYDENNRLISSDNKDSLIPRTYVVTYTYDENGNLLEMLVTYSDGNKLTTKYVYDENGNLYQIKVYYTLSGKKTWISTDTFTYDESGKLVQQYSAYSDGNSTKDYVYDENGHLIKVEEIFSSGKIEVTEAEWTLVYIPFDLTEAEFAELFFLNEYLLKGEIIP